MSNNRGNDGSLLAFFLGLLGGALAAYAIIRIIEGVTSYECPECEGTVRLGARNCPHCGTRIEWE